MIGQLIEKIKAWWSQLFFKPTTQSQREPFTITQQKKFDIQGEQNDPRPPRSYPRSGKNFEIEGERVIQPVNSNPFGSSTGWPKKCPRCGTNNRFCIDNNMTKLSSGKWKCKICDYTW